VLVALAIISIALLAALRVAGAHEQCRRTACASARGWVAENVLAEQRAAGIGRRLEYWRTQRQAALNSPGARR